MTYGELISKTAREMYAAYGAATGGKNFRGEPMPTWEALPALQREAWDAAAVYAVRELAGV